MHIDYGALSGCSDPALIEFLTRVSSTALKRRAQTAFPEFFTDDTKDQARVPRRRLSNRFRSVSSWGDAEDDMHDTLSWFGLPRIQYEHREDGERKEDSILLPSDFELKRKQNYNGLTAPTPWFTKLPYRGKSEEMLVLKILKIHNFNPSYFLWATPRRWIDE